jgi:hypothetical protein
MPDGFVDAIDNRLVGGQDVLLAPVQVENPAERLLRRRDVVALGT